MPQAPVAIMANGLKVFVNDPAFLSQVLAQLAPIAAPAPDEIAVSLACRIQELCAQKFQKPCRHLHDAIFLLRRRSSAASSLVKQVQVVNAAASFHKHSTTVAVEAMLAALVAVEVYDEHCASHDEHKGEAEEAKGYFAKAGVWTPGPTGCEGDKAAGEAKVEKEVYTKGADKVEATAERIGFEKAGYIEMGAKQSETAVGAVTVKAGHIHKEKKAAEKKAVKEKTAEAEAEASDAKAAKEKFTEAAEKEAVKVSENKENKEEKKYGVEVLENQEFLQYKESCTVEVQGEGEGGATSGSSGSETLTPETLGSCYAEGLAAEEAAGEAAAATKESERKFDRWYFSKFGRRFLRPGLAAQLEMEIEDAGEVAATATGSLLAVGELDGLQLLLRPGLAYGFHPDGGPPPRARLSKSLRSGRSG
eukprot:CAMPEP_0204119856 /NCGR_PEP_ID=MMETSP0361-20130328/7343_1 /ASSEMBLY_ACC=CAM_ASM_000343 /TAXON_ID=268821 /ORGANISM="Scrippsiella Hangoei, Strain SHTV-5" /LENGTH=419 /DNA_ID=CAMNT_0051071037 /DNA_START=43 /DNA_END=1302 /DNA_ORIENTATION=-